MAQPIRTLQKRGARNRIINDSVDEVMATILRNRSARREEERLARIESAKAAG
jgi:hypothetical protein